MANFSALKTAIQNAIKQNGNEEITGDVLQQILLSIVSTMGDGAINTIEQNLSNETTTRQGADTQLQNAINAIKANIDNGYVYAGIATPSATPVSGRVFYIATAAGTYTNFGGQVLTQGINILRYNGSAWSSQQLIGIDDVPTAESNSLVKSGGVQNELALGAVYDVSAKNPTGGPNNDGKWESIAALLSDANLNTLIPTTYRKGGMSIKFVQTYDNKYVRYNLLAQSFSTKIKDWQFQDTDNISRIVLGGNVKNITYSPVLVDGESYNSFGGTEIPDGPSSNTGWSCTKFKVHNGDIIELRGQGGSSVIRWFTTNDSETAIASVCNIQANVTVNETINITADGYFYFSSKNLADPYVFVTTNYITNGLAVIEGKIPIIENNVSDIKDNISNIVFGGDIEDASYSPELTEGLTYNSYGGTVIPTHTNINVGWSSTRIKVKNGDTIKLRGRGGSSVVRWFTTNSTDTTITGVCDIQNDVTISEEISISSDGYLYFNSKDVAQPYLLVTTDYETKGISAIEGNVSDIDKEVFGESETIDLTSDLISNYARQTNSTKVSELIGVADWKTLYIDVVEGDVLEVKGFGGSVVQLWCTANDDDTIIRRTSVNLETVIETIVIEHGETKFCYNTKDDVDYYIKRTTKVGGINNHLRGIDNALKESNYLVSNLPYLFNAVHGRYHRGYIQKSYIEGFLCDKIPVRFEDGGFSHIFSAVGFPESNGNAAYSLKMVGNGYQTKVVNGTQYNVTPKNAKNKSIRLLCIGDSWADAKQPYPNGEYKGGWAWPSCIKEFSLMDNEDYGNINIAMVGTRNNYNQSVHYNNKDITIRSFSEGRSGWTSTGYNQYPFPVKVGGAQTKNMLSIQSLWYASGLATMTPFDSSTPGKSWESWADAKEQRKLIVETPYGRYKPDLTSTDASFLWDELKWAFDSFTGTGTYTASAEQQALIIDFLNDLTDACANPFYDGNKAKAYTGSHVWTYDSAFSIAKYLERYRTMDNLGVVLTGNAGDTVQGSDGQTYTIGTKVVNTSDYDVCSPTHIFDGLGMNDRTIGYTDLAIEAISILLNEIEDEGIQVGYGFGHMLALMFNRENMYSISIQPSTYKLYFDINEGMLTELGNTVSPHKAKTFVPVYQLLSSIGNAGCSYAECSDNGENALIFSDDAIHPSIFGHRSFAYQVLSWIYYTLQS